MEIIYLDEVPSTNNYATSQLSNKEVSEGTIFLTFRQTQGRGQAQNVWESEDFMNLTFSLVIKPEFMPASSQFLISQMVSTGIIGALERLTEGVMIKWPNDILIGNRKMGGILIENSIMGSQIAWSVIGVGLNVNQMQFGNYRPEAISLKQILGRDVDSEELLFSIYDEIMSRYLMIKDGNELEVTNDYFKKLFRMGEWWKYRAEGAEFDARITGTDEFGRLRLEDRNGTITHWPFKGIEMIWDSDLAK
jgi:BirA family biotin operon repressor/biotin-[acetyl-CoA-carboxylase] ligase